MTKTALEMLQLRQRTPDEIVRAAARAREMLGDLGERPVLMEVQAAGLTLVIREHGTVDVEEPLLPCARGERLSGGSICQGQDLDMLHDPLRSTSWMSRSRRPGIAVMDRCGGAAPRTPSHRLPGQLAYAATELSTSVAASVAATRLRAGIDAAAAAPMTTTRPPTMTAGFSPVTNVAPEM